ncbi:hypothetical protein HID58_076049 [Brassica napus]|uniref:(rape) hypothetical protein n=1 Tax=Brassica napus TaxID=3708 RepID=A0A816MBM2_BRANA|nr:hypothetical protein HID58_076049 [Brassica napus]CAF1988856.1 unnamed protein product [Brassica napus]
MWGKGCNIELSLFSFSLSFHRRSLPASAGRSPVSEIPSFPSLVFLLPLGGPLLLSRYARGSGGRSRPCILDPAGGSGCLWRVPVLWSHGEGFWREDFLWGRFLGFVVGAPEVFFDFGSSAEGGGAWSGLQRLFTQIWCHVLHFPVYLSNLSVFEEGSVAVCFLLGGPEGCPVPLFLSHGGLLWSISSKSRCARCPEVVVCQLLVLRLKCV